MHSSKFNLAHRRTFSIWWRLGSAAVLLFAMGMIVSVQSVGADPSADTDQLAPAFVPLPDVTVSTGSVMLGDDFTISATFSNTGDQTGYGPFIDLYIPHVGVDGTFPDALTYDGISPASGTDYTATLGTETLTVVTQTFPDDGAGTGCVKHPWALDNVGYFLDVCGTAGDQLVSIQLPYGSYTPDQAPLKVSIPAHLSENANLGGTLTIRARAGFIYGRTPIVDWCCTTPTDTTIVSDSGTPDTWNPYSDVNPTVVKFSKSTNAGELATGPNNPATYTMTVNVATGQSFENIDITDNLPNSIVYMGNLTTNPTATTVSEPAVGGPYTGAQVLLHWDGPVSSDISVTFDYYVPDLNADGQPIAPGSTTNTATLDSITWIPSDGSTPIDVSGGVGPGVASHSDRPLTLGKSSSLAVDPASNGATPGDIVRYTMTFEISDYFGYANLSLEDVLSDGQHYFQNAAYYPELSITRDGSTQTYAFSAGNVDVACNYTDTGPGGECDSHDYTNSSPPNNDGKTTVTFNIAQELMDQVGSDQVLGDHVDDGSGSANATTVGTVTLYALIQDTYTDTFPGDSVKMGDSLDDSATISGSQVDPLSCNPGPCTITATVSSDGASAGVSVGRGTLEKTIVARNGAVCNPATFDPCASVQVAAGDEITYRITYDLLTGDFSNLSLTDFLPLPIFYADDPNVDGSSLTTWPKYTGAASIPDPGSWMLGPGDTRGFDPNPVSISDHASNNSVKFEFGSYDDTTNLPKKIDLLFTVRVTSEKFGDGMKMRNSVLQQDANSPGSVSTTNNFIDLTLTEPILVGEKTVVSTDHTGVKPNPPMALPVVFANPGTPGIPWNVGTTPINSDYLDANPLGSGIGGIDGGDMVKFAIVIENTGTGINGAFDITLKDVLPDGYIFPGVGLGGFNLQVHRGDGKALDDGTGSGFEFLGTAAAPGPDGLTGTPDDFFGAGVRLRDPADNPAFTPSDPEYGQGLCQLHEAASGKNVIIVTYDLMVDPDIAPGAMLQNEGQVTSYSGSEGGDSYIPEPITGTADSEIGGPTLLKELVSTEIDNSATTNTNTKTQVVIGELVTYRLTVTVTEGLSPSTQIVDTLDPELAFVSQDSFTNSNTTDVTISGSTTPTITDNGGTITWDLGTIENNNNNNDAAETLTFEYTAVVLNVSANQSGNTRNNSVSMTWATKDVDGNTVAGSQGPVSAENVTVVEPVLNIAKAATTTTGDAGDPLEYTLTIKHDAASETDAYDVTLSDPLPLCTNGESAIESPFISSVTDSDGLVTASDFELGGDNASGWTLQNPAGSSFDIPLDTGRSIEIKVSGALAYCVTPAQVLTNTSTVYWTSLDGNIVDRSGENTASDERTGADGVDGALNDYADNASATVTINSTTPRKYLVATSEGHTAEPVAPYQPANGSRVPLTIGEIARYRLLIELPEGTSTNFYIRDYIPNGMTFLNDGTAKAAFFSNDGIISSSYDPSGTFTVAAVADPNCQLDEDVLGATVDGVTPAIPAACPSLDTTNVSRYTASDNDAYKTASGATSRDVNFLLGTLENQDNDPEPEYVIVEFNVLVDNNNTTNSNDAGEAVRNRFRIYIGGNLISGYSNYVYGQIVEPSITNLTKNANPTTGDAGDTITYTLTFSNGSGVTANDSTAFDVVLTDTIHADMTANLSAMTVSSDDGGGTACATGVDTSNSSGNNLDVRFASVPVGCSVTITYSATLNGTVTADQVLDNTADLTYTSLPGDKGTSPNPTGSNVEDGDGTDNTDESGGAYGERNGSGTAPNDYTDTASANVTANALDLTKSLVDSSNPDTTDPDLTIGETATYRLSTVIPEGTSLGFTVKDTLPAGFTYVADSARLSFIADTAMTVPADIAGADDDALPPTFSLTASGRATFDAPTNTLTVTLGDLANNDRDNIDQEYVVVEFDVLVNNNADNNNTDLKNNNYTVEIDGVSKGPSNSVETRIVEPYLDVTKSADDNTWIYGQTVEYTLDIAHVSGSADPADDSNSVAYDIVVTDTIPAGLTFDSVTSLPAGWTQTYSAPDLTFSCLSSNSCSFAPADTPPSIAFTVTVDGPPAATALTGTDTATNDVTMTWTSMPNTNVDERTGDNSADANNDYLASDSHDGTLEYYAVGNRVWFDTDNNGLIDAGELGVDNVEVELYAADVSGAPTGPVLDTDTTVNGGYYLFDYLEGGDYVVVIPASNFVPTAVLEGYWSSGTSMDGTGVISETAAPDADTVATDSDDNGTLQPGGDVVALAVSLGPNGLTEPTGETDLSGGSYGEQPDGRANMTVDFGFYKNEIGNLVYLDNNANGTFDAGDTPQNGMTVELYAADGVTLLDSFTTTTISTDGEYMFTDLPDGDYIIKATGPAGTVSTRDDVNSADSADPDTNTDNNDNGIGTALGQVESGTLTMSAGETGANITVTAATGTTSDLTVDFGFVYPYGLGNRVWFDTDNSSTINGSEVGVAGVRVQLFESDGTTEVLVGPDGILGTGDDGSGGVLTDADGYYLFDYLFPGDYVVIIPASNFGTGAVLEGYWSSGTSVSGAGTIIETTAPDPDLGPDGVVGGGDDDRDLDDNGTRQGSGDVVSLPVTLGLSGLVEPTGESDLAGGSFGDQPDGRANMTVDFGFYRTEIGNLVYTDSNKNGNYDSGTDGIIPGMTVQLFASDGTTEMYVGSDGILGTADDGLGGVVSTDASGLYLFSGLPEGDYIVRAAGLANYTSTVDTYDSADNANPDTNTDNNDNGIGTGSGAASSGTLTMDAAESATNITVSNGTGTTTDLTVDFGFLNAYSLGNRVWFDTDNSSTINGSEVGVNDVDVELYAADVSGAPTGPVLDTVTTANGGYYLFDYLDAGDYVVVLPASNFTGTGKLVGYWSSGTTMAADGTITETAAPDPDLGPDGVVGGGDDDLDSDDNGTFAGGRVLSSAVTLGPGASEPTGETDLDGGVGQGAQPDVQANMTVDFGFYRASLGNQVYLDENLNGNYESGTDTPAAGITVQLYSSNGTEINVGPDGALNTADDAPGGVTTDASSGQYLFSNLPQGDYIIQVTAPANTASTVDTDNAADTTNPDTNDDNNDNGIGTSGGAVPSGIFSLTPGSSGALNNNTVTDSSGETNNPTVDFGFVNLYALGNRVWFDTDNSSDINGSEVGVDGVTVQLYSSDGSTEIPVGPDGILGTADDGTGGMVTADGGYYLFDNLYPGDYLIVIPASNFGSGAVLEGYWSSATSMNSDGSLSETAAPDPDLGPDGAVGGGDDDLDSDDNGTLQTSGALSGSVTSLPVTLGPVGLTEPTDDTDEQTGVGQGLQPNGRANLSVDFGFYKAEIGNLVFGDVDKNGNYESATDTLFSGVTVQLYSSNGTEINVGPDGTLGTGDDAAGGITTDASGHYLFSGLPAGDYIVRVVAPNGTVSTIDTFDLDDNTTTGPNINTDDNDNGQGTSDGTVTSGTLTITPGSSGAQGNNMVTNSTGTTSNPTVDFGFTTVYALGNRVWFDTNNNNTIDNGETGVDNVLVELYAADASGNPTGSPLDSDTTANGGYYIFDYLEDGQYVTVVPASNFGTGAVLDGYWSTGSYRNADGTTGENPEAGADTNQDSDDNGTVQTAGAFNGSVISSAVTLGPGSVEPISEIDLDASVGQGDQPDNQANMTVDFGFYTMELGNLVWDDADNSGTVTGTETGLAGVDVELWTSDESQLLATETTDTNGIYTFTGLPHGDYILRIPSTEFEGTGPLRDYVSSTGAAPLNPYEPAPNAEADTIDSDDNGTTTGSQLLGLGGYIQSSGFSLIPGGEDANTPAGASDNSIGLTSEPRIDFGVYQYKQADASITKTDGQNFYLQGDTLIYTVVVSNTGPSDLTGAQVSDPRPSQIATWTWACTASTGGASGCAEITDSTADFVNTVDLPINSSITYTVTANVDLSATGDLVNTATITVPANVTELNSADNSVTDTDKLAALTVIKSDGVSVAAPGTTLTYNILVENYGAYDLTDITITDTLPADVTYQNASIDPDTISGNVLTWNGIGMNIGDTLSIDVEVRVNDTPTGATITNAVEVFDTVTESNAAAEDTDTIAVDNAKIITNTNVNNDTDTTVFIGEVVTYEINLTVPPGTLVGLKALDQLEEGLAFDECQSASVSDPTSVTTTLAGGFANACPADAGDPNVTDSGHSVVFDFGDVTNTSGTDQTITVQYTVDVLDIASNVDGVAGLNNNVAWTWDGGSLSASAPPLDILEPNLSIIKDASRTLALPGNSITFTIDIEHTDISSTDAYDVVVTDQLPTGLEYVGNIIVDGLTYDRYDYDTATSTITFEWDVFPLLATSSITFEATFVGPPPVVNEASVAWTSIPLDPGVQSNYNADSTERFYDPLNPVGVNSYGVSSSVTIRRPALPKTGFAPNRVTPIPVQPDDKQYTQLDELTLEIPRLDVSIPVMGVPSSAQGWDLTWLSNQAGWLEGTAYPTLAGNTGLTAHTYLADGTPGPFVNLGSLYWGDQVYIHANGNKYTYEVREVRLLWPEDVSVLRHEEYDWITLITCRGYNEKADDYTYRVAVRAVLVNVEAE